MDLLLVCFCLFLSNSTKKRLVRSIFLATVPKTFSGCAGLPEAFFCLHMSVAQLDLYYNGSTDRNGEMLIDRDYSSKTYKWLETRVVALRVRVTSAASFWHLCTRYCGKCTFIGSTTQQQRNLHAYELAMVCFAVAKSAWMHACVCARVPVRCHHWYEWQSCQSLAEGWWRAQRAAACP